MSKEILSSTRVFGFLSFSIFINVLVGNISYDSTEQQLIDLFSEIGEVVNFTIVTDRDTGKQKGFGFCDFTGLNLGRREHYFFIITLAKLVCFFTS